MNNNEISKIINIALAEQKPINIIYQSEAGFSQRTIYIRAINGNSLLAYCLKSRQIRRFNADKILSAQIIDINQEI